MEKGFNIEKDLEKSSRWRKALPVLAAAVVVLLVAFVALTVSGSWYIQQFKSSCIQVPSGEQKEEFDIKMTGESQMTEHIVVFNNLEMEFITIKEEKTGYITQIATVDYKHNTISIYSSAVNKCVLANDTFPGIGDDLEYFRTHNGRAFDSPREIRNYIIGDRVTTTDSVPFPMMPYCTLRNTYMVKKIQQEGRVKRGGRLCWGVSLGRLCIGVSWESDDSSEESEADDESDSDASAEK